jgi:hypothetical protein
MNQYIVKVYTEKEDGVAGTYWYDENDLNFHRIEGPAIEKPNGDKFWFIHGRLHRLDGPAMITLVSDNQYVKYWCVNDNYHRLDGPAVELPSGEGRYYIKGKLLYKEDFDKEVAKLSAPKFTCDGKVVEIEGKKYQLKLVE